MVNEPVSRSWMGNAFEVAQFLCHLTPVFKQMISGYTEGQNRLLFMTFEKLDLFLMFFSCSQGGESAKVSTLIGLGIFFAGVKPVFSRF